MLNQETDERLTTRETRMRRWNMAREILGRDHAIFKACLRPIAPKVAFRVGEDGKGYFDGLATCGHVWACPVCAAGKGLKRASELGGWVGNYKTAGGIVLMLTLTFSHKMGDNLRDILLAFRKAQAVFRQSHSYRNLKGNGLLGTVSSLEVTHGRNGWHPHAHILMFFTRGRGEDSRMSEVSSLGFEWSRSLEKRGLSCGKNGFQVQDGSGASAYVSKWGIGEEVAAGAIKRGRNGSVTPFQLLDMAGEGDKKAGRLFEDFVWALRGKGQLVYSKGFKLTLKSFIPETPQEMIEGEEKPEETDRVVMYIQPVLFMALRAMPKVYAMTVFLLETGQWEEALDYLRRSFCGEKLLEFDKAGAFTFEIPDPFAFEDLETRGWLDNDHEINPHKEN